VKVKITTQHISKEYLDGYSDCLSDIEKALPRHITATTMEMLNSFIVALHLGKESVAELQKLFDFMEDHTGKDDV